VYNARVIMITPNRVLIANRGEIAIRIATAAQGLGMETVAVYPQADAKSLHTSVVDQACLIPAADPAASPIAAYLDIDAVVAIAQESGCDAVHPGYGFLAENATFASAVIEAGLTFVGPPPEALGLFGNKVEARKLAIEAGVPVVPGTNQRFSAIDEARLAAEEIGYPVMLKAAAGGGGRGMRQVFAAKDLDDGFERATSEAQAAFGDGSLFIEKLIASPRHIEVQVLGDHTGEVIHLFERDCSVQQRHQKVVEIAPAAHLDPSLRDKLLDAACTIAKAGGIQNAATVEFLVSGDEFWFIECNPRLQVEHTVTEQVMGIDIVETQFLLAGGNSLADLGLSQESVGKPRGYSVQARVTVTTPGTITGYKEPTGAGVRVDAFGYAGYTPPPQFDPLLAKVIGTSGAQRSLKSALARTRRALEDFHLVGVGTNIGLLAAILEHDAVQEGSATTHLLADNPDLTAAAKLTPRVAGLLSTAEANAGRRISPTPNLEGGAGASSGLAVADGQQGVASPSAGTVVELVVAEGDTVAAGSPILVLSAMKMETVLTAPVAGTVAAVQTLGAGDPVQAGQVVAVLVPAATGATSDTDQQGPWAETLAEIQTLKDLAAARLGPESTEPGVVRQRNRNKLTCRQRIDLLLDQGSFREIGSAAGFASYDADGNIVAFTPANHVGGTGTIDNRPVVVTADDFTSRGGHSDGAIGAKSTYLDRLSLQLMHPKIRLLDGSSGGGSVASMVPQQAQDGESKAKESSGAITPGRPRVAGTGGSFLPGHLGSTLFTEQLATVPVVNMLLGSVVGLGAAKAVLGHFSVMVKDIAQLFVAGPPVVSHAVGYDITKEDLGGWHIHCTNGSVDNLAHSEEEAMEMAQRFLSYLPRNVYEAPPVAALPSGDRVDRAEGELGLIIPRSRTTTFDIRRTIELLADRDSFFEIGPYWGTDQVTGFVRFNGYPMGVIASDSRHENGGALTADGCRKLTRHLDLCDLFHLPVLNLVDNPGFAVGVEHEITSTIRKGGEWMVAFAQTKVPIFTVIMRRSFGVAGNNFATPRAEPSYRVVWPSADVGGIPPEGGIEAAYKRQLAEADDPAALRAELNARIESARGPLGPLSRFEMEELVDPRSTRQLVCEWVPHAFANAARPAELKGRDLGFRP